MTDTLMADTSLFVSLQQKIDSCLDSLLPSVGSSPAELHEAMRYSVLAGGKRLRPILAITSYQATGGKGDAIMAPACALELLHTYSLIHDDLPCMDDDDFRRGQPTLHRQYPEYVAVLAGDALHALAFVLLAETGNSDIVAEVGRAIGTGGMLGGQVRDVQAEGKDVTLAQVEDIHKHKTAALITASVKLGAMLAEAPSSTIEMFEAFGRKLGLAFQIVDDILDIEGDPQLLGKSVGADNRLAKATYPKVVGLVRSREIAARLIAEAKATLADFQNKEVFCHLADYILSREH
ncbi:MAG: polyprenyl synthetase family protein [candidate division Zixibacteria bacterium]|nr:polyprenyl synthetase family protein [candidate division Zixibacteria bacterium]